MLLTEIDFLMDLERELLLRKRTRIVDLPKTGRQPVEAYALVWDWYDRLLTYRHSAGEDQIKRNWQACMDEEGLNAADALVRLVYVYVEGAERLGLDLVGDDVRLEVAQKHMAAWRKRRQESGT
ncbi:MAG: hypothetical protein KDA50_06455 [Rhodobacteraceae bacterium]|nr:hypothetical protein [Paracoccaceae bacterium]